jgi:DNA-directed RNA polymerase subunit beta
VVAPKLTRIFSSPEEINLKADQALIDGIKSQFPIENNDFRLELQNVHTVRREFDHNDEKEAILKSRSLVNPIRGDLVLVNKHTGKVVDTEKGFNLMDSFALTQKHALVYKGNNYSVANQLQLLPGIYTRRKANGELESHLNTFPGRSFSVTLEPQTGVFYVAIESAQSPFAPLLIDVYPTPYNEVIKYIPKEIWDHNLHAYAGNEQKYINWLYTRLVDRSLQKPGATRAEMVSALHTALQNCGLSTRTTRISLGKEINHVSPEALLLTLRNLVQVYRGDREEDNRDSLQFKRVQNLPDYLKRRFETGKEHPSVTKAVNKIQFAMGRVDSTYAKVRDMVVAKPFNKVYTEYILKSPLVATPSETNPIERLENVAKVTVLGKDEGGIKEERGVPMTARNIDPSHLGIIDPSRTPESSHAGIDQRFTIAAHRDQNGILYAQVNDNNGKQKYIPVDEMMQSVVGFPYQEGKKVVQAQDHGQLKQVPRSKVEYWIPEGTNLYTVTTNLVPFLNSDHPQRLTMAGKVIPQALSLVDREKPLVQTMSGSSNVEGIKGQAEPFVRVLGRIISTVSPVKGTVMAVANDSATIKAEDGTRHKIQFVKNLPFNMKGFLDDEKPLVKIGDKITKNQVLAENNYTQDGELALGRNLNVAYMPYKGYNHEDGLVISRTASDALKSHHAYKVDYDVNEATVLKKALVKRYFPGKYTKEQLEKLDDNGFAIVGQTFVYGDPVYVVLEKREPTAEDRILSRLHKSLVNPYRDVSEIWTNEEPGTVVDAHTQGKSIRILLRSIKPLEIGDKLTGLHGNKGIVSLILEDKDMPYNKETGKPVDLLLNPASVTSRINLGQIMETAAAKIAQKTGKPYLVKNFANDNNIKTIKAELQKHGIKDTEPLVDPKTGKDLGNILSGPQYFLKLYKTTDQNYSARSVGAYDNMKQPTKGGEEGSKAVGYMEFLGLLGSNARKVLKEVTTVKSEENTDYWSKFARGEPLPKPRMTFATHKLFDYLRGAGINVHVDDKYVTASPLTDEHIMKMSNGELKEPLMLSSKNLEPEDGGLFDQGITGGLRGTFWSHYKLAEPIVNPTFENPTRLLLGLSQNEFGAIVSGATAVRRVSKGVFELYDTKTGKLTKKVEVSKGILEEPGLEENIADEDEEHF